MNAAAGGTNGIAKKHKTQTQKTEVSSNNKPQKMWSTAKLRERKGGVCVGGLAKPGVTHQGHRGKGQSYSLNIFFQ